MGKRVKNCKEAEREMYNFLRCKSSCNQRIPVELFDRERKEESSLKKEG